mmetsp:Transcript_2860/g.7848  ORF Transcript_2860/g.7848 Transcript_2860/m.7848 type:complete len:220 (-) Transcript_2860:84-743(-)
MMQETNDQQIPVVGDGEKKEGKNFIDNVCDPCGLVPDNLEEALLHKRKMKELKTEREAVANADPIIQTSQEEMNSADDDAAVDSMLSNFGIDCCGKAPTAADEVEVKEFPAEKTAQLNDDNTDEVLAKNEENISVMTGNNSHQTRSLADIAAKMDEIDLETAADDTIGDQLADDASAIKKMGNDQEWYKEPLYAGLIILCGAFSIAIFVMAILLIAHRN